MSHARWFVAVASRPGPLLNACSSRLSIAPPANDERDPGAPTPEPLADAGGAGEHPSLSEPPEPDAG